MSDLLKKVVIVITSEVPSINRWFEAKKKKEDEAKKSAEAKGLDPFLS